MALKKFGISPVMLAFIIGLIVASCYTLLFSLEEEEEEEELQKADKSYAQAIDSQAHTRTKEKRQDAKTGEDQRLPDSE